MAIVTGPVYVVYVLLLASIDEELLDFSTQLQHDRRRAAPTDADATVLVGFGLSYLLLFITILLAFVACFKAVSDAWLGSVPSISRSLRFALRTLVQGRRARRSWPASSSSSASPPACSRAIWIGIAWCLCLPGAAVRAHRPVQARSAARSR